MATQLNATPHKTLLGHPVGLFYLFATEFWERFSYYGMRSLLVLYIIDQFFQGVDTTERKTIAYGIFGAYGALVYATPVIGGVIADRFLGARKTIVLGAIIMALGHFLMAVPGNFAFYVALGLLIVGNGFFKPNISTLLGSLYAEGDQKREGGFTIFYMGINLGAFCSPLLCGWLGKEYGWHYGFGLAGIGMVIGLIIFLIGSKKNVLGTSGFQPKEYETKKYFGLKTETLIYIISFMFVPVFALLVNNNEVQVGQFGLMTSILSTLGIIVLIRIGVLMYQESRVNAHRLFVIIILTFISMVFWSFFEQAGTSLTIFADENVLLPSWCNAAQAQSINPFVIIVFSIPFALMWPALGKKNLNPNSIIKTFLGLFLLGIGFLVFAYSANFRSDAGKVPFFYLVAGYFILTIGELCLSPTNLSKVTELSPVKIVSFMMGVSLLSSSFAHHLGGIIAKLTVPNIANTNSPGLLLNLAASITGFKNGISTSTVNGVQSLAGSTVVFAQIGIVAIAVSIVLLIVSPFIKKLMHGVH
jgi:POT family proton-dependent oligopeptide transporter